MKPNTTHRAFTLIELLVTIGIIVILIGILIPTVSKIKTSAYTASTQAMLSNLSNAITAYAQANGGAFPGPISNDNVYDPNFNQASKAGIYAGYAPQMIPAAEQPATPVFDYNSFDSTKISMAQNLVLGLIGGLYVDTGVAQVNGHYPIYYDPSRVGPGPMGLNSANPSVNRRAEPYFQAASGDLSWRGNLKIGHFLDDSGDPDDTNIPVFVDKFPSQMPILYLRAKAGANYTTAPFDDLHNPVFTDDLSNTNARLGQYDLSQIISYTGAYTISGTWPTVTHTLSGSTPGSPAAPAAGAQSIGVGKKISSGDYVQYTPAGPFFHGLRTVDSKLQAWMVNSNVPANYSYQYPYDGYAYFKDPNSSSTSPTARKKDEFILISPGPDRIYGTKDDIVTFGDINP